MSIITTIRNRSGLAIAFVAVALALFLISDALNSNTSLLRSNITDAGSVKGEPISRQELDLETEQNVINYKNNTNQNVDDRVREMLRDQAWNNIIEKRLMVDVYDNLGIEVSSEEVFDMVQGANPHPTIKAAPIFQNQETKEFDRKLVLNFLKSLDYEDEESQLRKSQWISFERSMMEERIKQKYSNLIKNSIYITKLEAEEHYLARNKYVDLKVVGLNYASIADTSVQVNDADLKRYFDEHYDEYAAKETSREIEYAIFDIVPSKEDTISVREWAEELFPAFKDSKDDSLFVDLNSESGFDTLFHSRSSYPAEIEDTLFTGPVGTTVGPFYENGYYKLYKVLDIAEDTLTFMRASHILIKAEGSTDEDTAKAMDKAREILADIRGGEDFAEMAAEFGTDGTAERGGDLGWFGDGQMVKPFNDAVKNGKKGDMLVVKSQFGAHVVHITEDATNKTIKVGMIDRKIEPGSATVRELYNKANRFAADSRSIEKFEESASKLNISPRIANDVKLDSKNIPGIPNARPLIRWTFEAEKGQVSEVIELEDRFIVAALVEIREEGTALLADVEEEVRNKVIAQKKAEQFIEQFNSAIGSVKTPEELGEKIGAGVTPMTNRTFENTNLPFVGEDPTLTGMIFGSQAEVMSQPYQGETGVYVYMVTKVNEPSIPEDISTNKEELKSQLAGRAETDALNAIKENADIEDNRPLIY